MLFILPLVCRPSEESITRTNKIILSIMMLETKFGSFYSGDDGELTSVGLVEISKIFAAPDNFFHNVASFDRVYQRFCTETSFKHPIFMKQTKAHDFI